MSSILKKKKETVEEKLPLKLVKEHNNRIEVLVRLSIYLAFNKYDLQWIGIRYITLLRQEQVNTLN